MRDNLESVVYVGGREAVVKFWERRGYTFKRDKPVFVPDAFAAVLFKSNDFVRRDDVGRTLEERFPAGERRTLLLRRWGALGDLIMFRAAVSAFARARPDLRFAIRCQERFIHLFQHDPLWAGRSAIGVLGQPAIPNHGAVSFDQTAEADHRGDERHRVDLFLAAMTKAKLDLRAADWELPVPDKTAQWVEAHLRARGLLPGQRQGPLVAVQPRGSGAMKSLPVERMKAVIAGIVALGAEVILVEPIEDVARQFAADSVHAMTHRDALHSIALLRRCDLAVTMDSGALWMAHAAPCPVLCVMGPTRPAQRITYHPLYPDGARAVCLNEIISCPPCFEKADACGRRFDCMQNQPDWGRAVAAVVDAAAAMLRGGRGDVALPVLSAVPGAAAAGGV